MVNRNIEVKQEQPANEFKASKRADHDELPDEIQALYIENLAMGRYAMKPTEKLKAQILEWYGKIINQKEKLTKKLKELGYCKKETGTFFKMSVLGAVCGGITSLTHPALQR